MPEEEEYRFKLDYSYVINAEINRVAPSVDETTFMIPVDHLRLLIEPYLDKDTDQEITSERCFWVASKGMNVKPLEKRG
jgi:hypothetical protein